MTATTSMSNAGRRGNTVVTNVLARYYAGVQEASHRVAAERGTSREADVAFELPELDDRLARFMDVSDISLREIDSRLYLMDLMRNPATRTVKTFASAVMVARAVRHIRSTGERVLLVTPTSGNKGTALRDAVARAYATSLASPESLRIAIVVPRVSRHKLRECPLSTDSALRAVNPVAIADVAQPADVKALGSQAVHEQAAAVLQATGFRLWYTLDIDNYRTADCVRAFAEADLMPIEAGAAPRVHAHAVSSAYGLLGYHLGHQILADSRWAGPPQPAWHPGLFLIQHLATPDMVVDLLGIAPPGYIRDPASGLWRQGAEPAFPQVTDNPAETIDPTFYTQAPPTSAQLNPLVKEHGGGGVVVSRRECLDRYDQIRELASHAGIAIETDPGLIREWSLVKGLAGVLVARERALLDQRSDVVLHASGYFTDALIPPLPDAQVTVVDDWQEFAQCLLAAAAG
jgi:Family of unknown function (DUF6002)